MKKSLFSFESLKNRLTSQHKIAFFSGIAFFVLIHMFYISNFLPNHDALECYYSDQNVISSGRWLLSLACLPSSFFNLTWVISVFCAVYIAVTCVIVVNIFKLQKTSSVVAVCGLIASFPAVSETMLFGYTADGYMLAMLLAALAVQLIVMENKRWYTYVAAGVLLCASCGIYQAYFSFALSLTLVYLVLEILKGKHTTKALFVWIAKYGVLYICSLVAYFAIWKVLMLLQNTQANDYQGLSTATPFSVTNWMNALVSVPVNTMRFLLGRSFFQGEISFFFVVSAIFAVVLISTLVIAVIKTNLKKRPSQLLLLLVALILMPYVAYMWQFVSVKVGYAPRMLQSLCFVYILPVVIADRYFEPKKYRVVIASLSLIIFSFSLQANMAYYYLNQSYETTYHQTSEMAQRIHLMSDTGEEKVAIIGSVLAEKTIYNDEHANETERLGGSLKTTLAYDQFHISLFMEKSLGEEFEFASKSEREKLQDTETVRNMGCWPAKNSVQVIDGYIVIKLTDKISK